MANYNWSALIDGQVIDPFDPAVDVLNFDDLGISAALLSLDSPDGTTISFTYGGKTITLNTAPYTLTSVDNVTHANVTFADGSKLIIGDDTTATASDDSANTITGGPGDDLLIGAGGDDSLSGGGGNDAFAIVGADADGIYGNDTIDGGAGGRDRIIYYDNNGFGVTVNLGNETTNGSATGGDASSSQ